MSSGYVNGNQKVYEVAKATVSGNANANNTPFALTAVRDDDGLAVNAGDISLDGSESFDHVVINAVVFSDVANNTAFQRVSPGLRLLRDGVEVATSNTGYQRHTSDHNSSSNTIIWVDDAPGATTTYELQSIQGSSQNDVTPVTRGSYSVRAYY